MPRHSVGLDGLPITNADLILSLCGWEAQKIGGFELGYGTHRYKGFGHDYKLDRKDGFFIHIESSGTMEK